MASTITSKEYNGTGSQNTFAYTFQSYQKEDIKVAIDGNEQTQGTHYQVDSYSLSGGTINFQVGGAAATYYNGSSTVTASPPAGTLNIRVYRETDITSGSVGEYDAKATYQAGSSIKAADLNNCAKQALYATFELRDQEIQETKIRDGAVTSAKIKDGTIAGVDIADDAIDSQHYAAGSIDLEHMSANSVDRNAIVNDAVNGTKIADDSIDSEHYVDGSIDNVHISDNAITGPKIHDDEIGLSHMKVNSVDSGQYVDNSIDGPHISNDAIDTRHYNNLSVDEAALAANCVTATKIAKPLTFADNEEAQFGTGTDLKILHNGTDSVIRGDSIKLQKKDGTENLATFAADGAAKLFHNNTGKLETTADGVTVSGLLSATLIDNAVGADQLASNAVTAAKIADNTITATQIADNAITNNELADNSVATGHIIDGSIIGSDLANGAVDTAKIANDAVEADQLLDHASDDSQRAVTTNHIKDNAITIAKIGCEETTLTTTSNTAIPTSKAVADHVANVVDSVGGFKIIANKDSFPEAHPDPKGDAGMVISITDPVGFVVNGSGVSTTGDTITSDGTVTINGFPSGVHSTTTTSNYTLLLQTTSTAHTYDFYRFLAKDADVLNLSSDIDDFGNRYRTGTNRTANNSNTNHDGDLFFDQSANKMYVYDGAYDASGAWKEVTSTGEFKILTLEDTDGSAFDGANQSFNLKDGSNAASVDQPGQLIVSVNGVIQKPNTGTSAPSEGFALVDSDTIIFGAAPGAGASVFVTQCGSAVTLNVPADDSVTAAKLNAGTETTGHYLSKTASGSGIAWAAVPAGVGGATGVDFNDDVKARFGTGNDLEIFHNGTAGYIDSTGNDTLFLRNGTTGGKIKIQGNSGEESIIANHDGSVELYYDNAKKLETASGGVTVTGTVAATSYTGDGSALTGVASATADGCIYENDQTISNNYTIASGKGAHSVGPITVNATVTVNGNWVVS